MAGITYILLAIFAVAATTAYQNQILKSNQKFALNAYNILSEKDRENVVFSPISAHAALSMVYQGADGSTKEAIASKLDLPEKSMCADSYHEVIQDLHDCEDVQISFANKAYVDKKVELQEEFENVCREKFLSDVEHADFSQKDVAASQINEWVEEKTEHKVKNLFQADDFQEEPDVVLVNSIYFKGRWADKLNIDRDQKHDFYLTPENKKEVNMMTQSTFYNFKDDAAIGAKVIEMPFKDQRFSMVFALPKERCALAQLEAQFKSATPPNLLGGLKTEHIDVKMPPFKIEKSIDLKAVMQELGLEELFDQQKCNLSGMVKTEQPLHVSKAIQKVVIDVNEEGCEAAASSGFGVSPASLPLLNFHADHPFLFSLVEKKGEDVNILFSGRVTDPEC